MLAIAVFLLDNYPSESLKIKDFNKNIRKSTKVGQNNLLDLAHWYYNK